MAHTSVDILLARITVLEARVASLEDHAARVGPAPPPLSDLDKALAKWGASIKAAGRRTSHND